MLPSTKRRTKDDPPSKIAGFLYVWIGIVALFLAAFVELVEGKLGPVSNFRIGLGVVIALWGLYRIFTGITMVRKAIRASKMVTLPGIESEPAQSSKPTV